MERNKRGDVTEMLTKFRRGDPGAEAKLVELVYSQLRRLAADYMRRERKDHSLPPTALVHEAYLRLIKLQPKVWQNRSLLCGCSAADAPDPGGSCATSEGAEAGRGWRAPEHGRCSRPAIASTDA